MKRLTEIFNIKNSPSLELINCEQVNNGICFVSRTSANNGIAARVKELDNLEPMPANAITVALSGSVLSSFYQDEPFYTAFHIACLYPKQTLAKEQMLYYAYIIEQNKYRYNYGRQANKTLKNILVPDICEIPDYVDKTSISDFLLDENSVIDKELSLNAENWKWFRYDDIFFVMGSKTTPKEKLEGYGYGIYPYITTQAVNNGIENYYDFYTEEGGAFTVDSAVLGFCAYQEKSFSASDHVEKLIPKFNCNKYIAIFITTLINKEQYRYNYGRKFSQKKIRQSKIKLPVMLDDSPDWQFMEDYIKSLSYSKCL